MSEPEITVIMPVRNEAAAIESALDDVLAQVVDVPLEIVVAEGGSTDDTRAILERRAAADGRIRVVDNPHGGTPQALNAALDAARGRYVVRVDGHSRLPADYIVRLVRHLRSGRCEGAGGIKRAVGRSPFGQAAAAVWMSPFGIGDSPNKGAAAERYVDHVPFGSYHTELARKIGGWDESFVRNQDSEFDYRFRAAGGRILLDPSIVVDWGVRESPGRLAKQYFQYGFWRFRTFRRHRGRFYVRWLVPPLLLLALVGGILLSWTTFGLVVLAATLLAYGAFVVLATTALARKAGFRLLPQLALALVTIHLCWGAGFVVSALQAAIDWVRGRKPAQPPGPR